jgi:hypothetical protein
MSSLMQKNKNKNNYNNIWFQYEYLVQKTKFGLIHSWGSKTKWFHDFLQTNSTNNIMWKKNWMRKSD